jgi:hypothetical protein
MAAFRRASFPLLQVPSLVSERPYCITLASRYGGRIGERCCPLAERRERCFRRLLPFPGAVGGT